MAVVNTSRTFTNNEQITSTKLNQIMDESSFTSDAIVANQGLQITAGGQMQIPNSGITTALIGDNQVTTAKIANSNITTAKIADLNVTTAKIANGGVTPAKLAQPLTSATAQNSTSGTSIDFTGIPSWVKRITVMFNGVSTNGSSVLQVQIGSGSFTTSGYNSTATSAATSVGTISATSGFAMRAAGDTNVISGQMVLTLVSGNNWASSHMLKVATSEVAFGAGDVSLSGTLDRVRITTVNGTDTFDAGSINIMYE